MHISWMNYLFNMGESNTTLENPLSITGVLSHAVALIQWNDASLLWLDSPALLPRDQVAIWFKQNEETIDFPRSLTKRNNLDIFPVVT